MTLNWEDVKTDLQKRILERSYKQFIEPLAFLSIKKNELRLFAPTQKVANYVETRYKDEILKSIKKFSDSTIKTIVIEHDIVTKKENKIVSQQNISNIDTNMFELKVVKHLQDNYEFKLDMSNFQRFYRTKSNSEWRMFNENSDEFNDLFFSLKEQIHLRALTRDNLLFSIKNSRVTRRYHTLHDYYPSIKNEYKKSDGDLFGQWLNCLKFSNTHLGYADIRKFLFQSVHTLMTHGDFFNDSMLIIQGKQGIGKSRLVKSYIPPVLLPFFDNARPKDLKHDKDYVIRLGSMYIWNFDDLQNLSSYDSALVKQFLSTNDTMQRKAFAPTDQYMKRTCSVWATTNVMNLLNNVEQGNRKLKIFSATSIDHMKAFSINKTKMHSQIFMEYNEILAKHGESYFAETSSDIERIELNNLNYSPRNEIENAILKYFKPLTEGEFDKKNPQHKKMSATEIAEFINQKENKFYTGDQLGYYLKRNLFIQKRTATERTFYVLANDTMTLDPKPQALHKQGETK